MRLALLIAMGALATAAAPAQADTVIRYELAQHPGRPLVIQADGAGHVRADNGDGQTLILRDGEIYALLPNPDGGVTVARFADFMGVMLDVFRQMFGAGAFSELPAAHFTATAHGRETVGQWQGTRHTIDPAGPGGEAGDSVDVVVSEDPALAPAGRPVAQVFGALMRAVFIALGAEQPELATLADQTFARGLVLRLNQTHRLTGIAEEEVAPERYALPGPVLDRAQLRALMMAQQEARAGE